MMQSDNFFNPQQWSKIIDKSKTLDSNNEVLVMKDINCTIELFEKLQDPNAFNNLSNSQKDFFLTSFIPSITRSLLNHRQYQFIDTYQTSEILISNIIELIAKNMHLDNISLSETFKQIFDPSRGYYKCNNQDENLNSLLGYQYFPNNQILEWQKSLKQGDELDAIFFDDSVIKKFCWSRATILHIIQNNNDIKISFQQQYEKYDRYVNMNSFEIAPLNTMADDFEWRIQLDVGQLIDVCDTSSVWYSSTVLKRKVFQGDRGDDIIKIHVGYRIQSQDGDKFDEEGNSYIGWSEKFDEWLPVTSPRIAKYGTLAKKIYKASSQANSEEFIEDSADMIYKKIYEKQKFCAILRQSQTNVSAFKCISLVNFMNNFLNANGFYRLLDRIQDRDNWIPFDILINYIYGLGNLYVLYYRLFALEYIPLLWEACTKYILDAHDQILRTFSNEKFDIIFRQFSDLLKRVYSIGEKKEKLEYFQMELALKCINCDFLHQKIIGIKLIQSAIQRIQNDEFEYFNLNQIQIWLLKNQIFEKILGSQQDVHSQVIERSSDIITFMFKQNLIKDEYIDDIWNLINTSLTNKEKIKAIFKVLGDFINFLQKNHLQAFVQKFCQTQPDKLLKEHIEFISNIFNRYNRQNSLLKDVLDRLWDIFSSQDSTTQYQLKQLAQEKFIYMIQNLDNREEKYLFITKSIENVQNYCEVLTSIRIMRQIIEGYTVSSTDPNKETKSTVAQRICRDYPICQIIVKDIQQIKKTHQNVSKEQNEQHVKNIDERINFLKLLNQLQQEQENILNIGVLRNLYSELVEKQQSIQEAELFFKWVQQIFNNNEKSQELLQFQQFILDSQKTQCLSNITVKIFDSLKNIFIAVNIEKKYLIPKIACKIICFLINQGKEINYTQRDANGRVISISNSSAGWDNEKKFEFDYQVDINPKELIGIDNLWQMLELCKDNNVIFAAAEFLTYIYTDLTSYMEQESQTLKNQFLNICIDKLKLFQQQFDLSDKKQKEELSQRISSYLRVIRVFLCENEKFGIGDMKSHSGLVKGELQTIQINNNIGVQQNNSKKIEIKMFSNQTVLQLRLEISKQISMPWEHIKLRRQGYQNKDIGDNENGRTLGDLRIKQNETLTINRRQTPPIPQAQLVDRDGNLLPKPIQIFTSWYYKFADPETLNMRPIHLSNFISSCTNDKCKESDNRVINCFNNYDKNKDGILELEDFLTFYKDSSNKNKQAVWKNFKFYHIRNDLKTLEEINNNQIEVQTLPRYILMQNEEFYQLLFDFLAKSQNEDLTKAVWKMLQLLPASRTIMKKIINLEGVKGAEKKDWSNVFDEISNFKLLYILTIIEYLMEDDEEFDQQSPDNKMEIENQQIQDSPKKNSDKPVEWRQEFIYYGGFEQLFRIFQRFVLQTQFTILDKEILSFILKITRNYLTATLHLQVPHLYKITNYARLTQYKLETIDENLKEAQQELEQAFLDKQIKIEVINSDISAESQPKNVKIIVNNCILQNQEAVVDNLKKYRQKMRVKESKEFLILANSLQGELGKKIIDTLDLPKLLQEIINLIFSILKYNEEMESEDRAIIDYGLSIILAIVLYDENCLQQFIKNEKNGNSVIAGLFCSQSNNIRKVFMHSLYLLVRQTKSDQYYIWLINLLIDNLPTQNKQNLKDCNQYYDLLCKILQDSTQIENIQLDFESLIAKIIEQLYLHESKEKRNQLNQDKLLIGFLNLIEKILKIKPQLCVNMQILCNYLLNTCLFSLEFTKYTDNNSLNLKLIHENNLEYDPIDYVKTKSQQSRKLSYKIIQFVYKQCPHMIGDFLQQTFLPLINQIPILNTWNHRPLMNQRSVYNFVGIKNLGATCYMNAMLQQFFLTPTFRYGILSCQDNIAPNLQEYKGAQQQEVGKLVDDNLLHQLQRLFAFLELSDRQDYNSFSFCFSYKDFDQNPIDVMIQQDAQEFINRFFDLLENRLKDSPYQKFTENVFGGTTCSQLICPSCKKIKENNEIFYNLSITVKNMKSLQESLENMIKPEKISDYFCENCEKKQDIMDTLQNVKINSKFEFPQSINLKPFTLQNEAKVPHDYQLKGIVAHIGTAAQGHYISYIQVKAEKWLEFNDSLIKDFDIKELEQECFGGAYSNTMASVDWPDENEDPSSKSAYILVYERVNQKYPLQFPYQNEQEKQQILQDIRIKDNSLLSDQNGTLKIDFFGLDKHIQLNYFKDAWIDNHNFMLEKHIYNEDFFDFIKEIMDSIQIPQDYKRESKSAVWSPQLTIYLNYKAIPEQQQLICNFALRQLHKYIFDIIGKASDNEVRIFLDLIPQYAYDYFKDFFYLKYKEQIELMLSSPDQNVRVAYSRICGYSISVIIYINNLTLNVNQKYIEQQFIENQQIPQLIEQEQVVIMFMNYCFNSLNQVVAQYWTKMNEFLEMIRDFVRGGEVQIAFCFSQQLIARLIDFYLQKESPITVFGEKQYVMGNYQDPKFDALIETLGELVYRLQQNDDLCLNNPKFYIKSLQKNYSPYAMSRICDHLSYQNQNFSKNLALILIDGICAQKIKELPSYLEVTNNFILIADQYKNLRIEWILGVPMYTMNRYNNFALLNSLDDMIVVYETNLLDYQNFIKQSILQFMFNTRKRFEKYVIMVIDKLIELLERDDYIRDYFMKLPPPNYLYSKYIDWIGPFIREYIEDAKKYQEFSVNFNKEEYGQGILGRFIKVEEAINQKISNIKAINQQISEQFNIQNNQTQSYSNSISPLYIIGKTVSEKVIKREIFYNTNNKLASVVEVEVELYLTDSKPNGYSNQAIPNDMLDSQNSILLYGVDSSSSIFQIVLDPIQYNNQQMNGNQANFQEPPPLEILMEINGYSNNKIKEIEVCSSQNKKRPRNDNQMPESQKNGSKNCKIVLISLENQDKEINHKVSEKEQNNMGEIPLTHIREQNIPACEQDNIINPNLEQNQSIPPASIPTNDEINFQTTNISQNITSQNYERNDVDIIEEEKQNAIPLGYEECKIQNEPFIYTKYDIDVFQCAYLRKIQVENQTDDELTLTFQFQQDPEQIIRPNCYIPLSQIQKRIMPQSNHIIWTLNKQNIHLDWGEYKYSYNYNAHKSNDNLVQQQQHQLEQQNDYQPQIKVNNSDNQDITDAQLAQTNKVVIPLNNIEQNAIESENNGGRTNPCPRCTYLNYYQALQCEMCEDIF